jgi:Mg-chelatase subunit ChlD
LRARPTTLAIAALLLCSPSAAQDGRVRLALEQPAQGALVEGEMFMVELRGRASAAGDGEAGYDVMLVLDTSDSTKAASGVDIDGDGVVGEDPRLGLYAEGEVPEGVWSTDPGDTVLHAEIAAALRLLDGLDARRVRVGLVTFAGASDPVTQMAKPGPGDARLRVAPTSDFARVRTALAGVLAEGASGGTNFAAGIRLAANELSGVGAAAPPRAGAKRVMLFLTDGIPGSPAGLVTTSDDGDLEAAVAAARFAQAAGVRIHSYAIGTDALARPKAATEIARVTLGQFTPVKDVGAIAAALQASSFANIEDVGVVNLTTQETAPDVRLHPDGSFQAFVPVREGANRLLVNALASDGSGSNLEVEVRFRPKAASGRQLAADLERLRRLNDELMRHLEVERIKAAKREQRLRKELEIRVEQDGEEL